MASQYPMNYHAEVTSYIGDCLLFLYTSPHVRNLLVLTYIFIFFFPLTMAQPFPTCYGYIKFYYYCYSIFFFFYILTHSNNMAIVTTLKYNIFFYCCFHSYKVDPFSRISIQDFYYVVFWVKKKNCSKHICITTIIIISIITILSGKCDIISHFINLLSLI